MDKGRLEALSDSVFAVAMTLLVVDVTIPISAVAVTNRHLWYLLGGLWPLFVSYAFTFLILSVFWINHHFLFHVFVKTVNRNLNLLNMVYLMFLVFVPFSARLFGSYPSNEPAVIIYGVNILIIAVLTLVMQAYVRGHKRLRNESLSLLIIIQAQLRISLTIFFYVLGIGVSFVYIPASIFFFLFPLIFNIIPGTLTLSTKLLRMRLPDEKLSTTIEELEDARA